MAITPIESGGGELLGACIALIVIETVFIVLRTVSRAMSQAKIAFDDVIVTATFPVLVALNACLISMVIDGGAGWHTETLIETYGTNPVEKFLKLQVAVAELYFVAMSWPKFAIVSLYLRIFTSKPVRVICRILQVVLILYPLGWFIGFFAVCRPASAVWDLVPPPDATCGDLGALEKYISVPNIVTDVIMLVLPLHSIQKLHLPLKDRIGVAVILCAGGMGLIVSCIRFAFWYRSDLALSDLTYVATTIGKFTTLEAAGYFIAACVPVLRPVVEYIGRLNLAASVRSLRSILSSKKSGSKFGAESLASTREGKELQNLGSNGIQVTHDVSITREPRDSTV